MRRIIAILLSFIAVETLFVGCDKKNNNSNNENTNELAIMTQNEEDLYVMELEEVLEEFNINNIDILISKKTKKLIISLQINFNGKINKKDVKKLVNEIEKNIKPISELYDITIIDKNNQIIAIARNDDNRKVEFME